MSTASSRARRSAILRGSVGVDHARPVRRGDKALVADPVLESRHPIDVGLAVIRADDDGVALQELVQAARGFYEGAHGLIAASERLFGTARAERVGGVVVVRQVVEEEVESVACDEPSTHRRCIGVDRPSRPRPDRQRRAGDVRLEEAEVEEAAGAVHRAHEPGDGWNVPRPSAVAGGVHGRSREACVLERLEHRRGVAGEVVRVHLDDRVTDRAPGSRSPHRAEGRAVLDQASLPAVVPDEMRDLVDVRMCPGRERGHADGSQRRKGRHRARIAPGRVELRERRCRPPLDGLLEDLRSEPVDDDEDQLSGHQSASVRSPA